MKSSLWLIELVHVAWVRLGLKWALCRFLVGRFKNKQTLDIQIPGENQRLNPQTSPEKAFKGSKHLPSLKLTACTWKWMVGILVSFWGRPIFRGYVSFREGIHQVFGGFWMSREITRANCLDHFLNLPGKFDGKFQLRVKRKLVSPSPTENPKSFCVTWKKSPEKRTKSSRKFELVVFLKCSSKSGI